MTPVFTNEPTSKYQIALNIAEDVAGLAAIGLLFFAGLGLPYIV